VRNRTWATSPGEETKILMDISDIGLAPACGSPSHSKGQVNAIRDAAGEPILGSRLDDGLIGDTMVGIGGLYALGTLDGGEVREIDRGPLPEVR
jgi:hypothetical protein